MDGFDRQTMRQVQMVIDLVTHLVITEVSLRDQVFLRPEQDDDALLVDGGPVLYFVSVSADDETGVALKIRDRLTSELQQILEERCGCRVHMENDAKAATMAELAYGSLRGCRYGMAVTIGTYVGGGFVFDGKVYKGRNFRAGEINVICIEPDRWEQMDSTLGEHGSARRLLQYYAEEAGTAGSQTTEEEFFELVDLGDSNAARALKRFCRSLSIQLMNVAVPLELERIAVGGGISRQSSFISGIRQAMAELEETNPRIIYGVRIPLPEITACTFFNEANLLGAFHSYQHDL